LSLASSARSSSRIRADRPRNSTSSSCSVIVPSPAVSSGLRVLGLMNACAMAPVSWRDPVSSVRPL
jgi:hypothetical protein